MRPGTARLLRRLPRDWAAARRTSTSWSFSAARSAETIPVSCGSENSPFAYFQPFPSADALADALADAEAEAEADADTPPIVTVLVSVRVAVRVSDFVCVRVRGSPWSPASLNPGSDNSLEASIS